MGLETAVTIDQLIEAWPLQTDKIRQGAGHLRTIKGAVKTTFPNITEPMTKTAAALNTLPDDFGALLTELLKHVEKKGSIKVWDVANNAIPDGWVPCDGRTVSGYGVVPDMRDRFVVGAGLSYAAGATGGSISKTSTLAGGHTPSIQGHALTVNEMPPHGHTGATFTGSNDDNGDAGSLIITSPNQPNGTQTSSSLVVSNTGGGASHTHGADAVPDHSHDVSDVRPPYYAAIWIVKTTDYVAP